MTAEHKAYEKILTDPDVLADYTCEFFGPNGPYPVPEDGQPAMVAPQVPQAPQAPQAPQGYARPEMPVPPQPQANENPSNFWNTFGDVADRDPGTAWSCLTSAQQNPEVFRSKMLVMD